MQLVGRAVEDPLAVGEHQQAVAVALGLEQVVGREDHRRAAAGQGQHELPEALALARVEAGRGLVEQQHGGRREQPDRDVHPLLVTARERCDLVVAAVGQTGLLEHPLDRRVEVRDPLEAGEQAQVLGHRQPPVEARRLRNPADLPGGRDSAGVRLGDPGEDREQGGLAGSVGPDHGEQLARAGLERDRAQGGAIAVRLADLADRDHGPAAALVLGLRIAHRRES